MCCRGRGNVVSEFDESTYRKLSEVRSHSMAVSVSGLPRRSLATKTMSLDSSSSSCRISSKKMYRRAKTQSSFEAEPNQKLRWQELNRRIRQLMSFKNDETNFNHQDMEMKIQSFRSEDNTSALKNCSSNSRVNREVGETQDKSLEHHTELSTPREQSLDIDDGDSVPKVYVERCLEDKTDGVCSSSNICTVSLSEEDLNLELSKCPNCQTYQDQEDELSVSCGIFEDSESQRVGEEVSKSNMASNDSELDAETGDVSQGTLDRRSRQTTLKLRQCLTSKDSGISCESSGKVKSVSLPDEVDKVKSEGSQESPGSRRSSPSQSSQRSLYGSEDDHSPRSKVVSGDYDPCDCHPQGNTDIMPSVVSLPASVFLSSTFVTDL